MTPETVRAQIDDVVGRLIKTSLSVKQFYPSVKTGEGGAVRIGRAQSSAITLRDISYEDAYKEIEVNEAYDAKLIDGGLLVLQYAFDGQKKLIKHRLSYLPNPSLPTFDEAPWLYKDDELYGDIISRRLVRFPIRFDYAPADQVNLIHPASHLTLGQYEGCRIPVSGPLGPSTFANFIVRNFYNRAYRKNKNDFDKKAPALARIETISHGERQMSHFVHGR